MRGRRANSPKDSRDLTEQQKHWLLDGYKPVLGRFDELVDEEGKLREHWLPFAQSVAGLGTAELQRRLNQAQRQIAEDGITFNPHDVSGDKARPWVLDPVPMLIAHDEWEQLSRGLEQRAQLADLILLDLFGPQTLLQERVLPPDVLFGNPRYYPGYQSLMPNPKRHLHIFAVDLARVPDGRWLVTSERSRSPFGLGYALENRLITSRMLPVPFRNCQVKRMAPFFMTFRETLREMAQQYRENPRIAIWTKGPHSRAYFEDAFLARYLGYTLVEGGDLAVRDNRVTLKTLGGLLPVEVLYRRIEDHTADPVELDGDSFGGVAGLLEVIRSGRVAVANSLGSAIVESPIMLSFLPSICRSLLGQDLLLPSVVTWWCGAESSRRFVLENLDSVLIRHAYRTNDEPPIQPDSLTRQERQNLIDRINASPAKFVAQERVARSTAPVWHNGKLQPWSMAMRSYLVAKQDGYEALPGGLARVNINESVLEMNMASGEKSPDVWVLSKTPVEKVSLLGLMSSDVQLKRSGAELPSRAADNLFWLGRYVERAEQQARLARTTLQALTSEDISASADALLAACVESGLIRAADVAANPDLPGMDMRLCTAMFDSKLPASFRATIEGAVRIAATVRDRIALDSLRVISKLDEMSRIAVGANDIAAYDVVHVLDNAVMLLVAFAGLASESMTRTQGWRFLDLGRRIERSLQIACGLRALLPLKPVARDETNALEALLIVHDSIMTYRSRYLASLQVPIVLDLLVTDETNPRSLVHQLGTIANHVDRLPREDAQAGLAAEQRLALALHNSVRLADVFELAQTEKGERAALHRLVARVCEQLPKLSDAVSTKFLIHAGQLRHFGATATEKTWKD
jgi:uncharacterized circularly permuted ATP-grasp superfamily protein/uncharacterized alpha-E superfamily protein